MEKDINQLREELEKWKALAELFYQADQSGFSTDEWITLQDEALELYAKLQRGAK